MPERVASYKYPRAVEFREHLPMNATGKILKRSSRPVDRMSPLDAAFLQAEDEGRPSRWPSRRSPSSKGHLPQEEFGAVLAGRLLP